MAALPCATNSAPSKNRLWLLPPIANAAVRTQPDVRGCGAGDPQHRLQRRPGRRLRLSSAGGYRSRPRYTNRAVQHVSIHEPDLTLA